MNLSGQEIFWLTGIVFALLVLSVWLTGKRKDDLVGGARAKARAHLVGDILFSWQG